MNPHVHLLVKIVKQSKESFLRWCKIHSVYGFARIYVFDDGSTPWYNEAKAEVSKLYDNFTFLNTDQRWNKRSEMIKAYCKHCNNGDWGVILASNEFIYTEHWHKFDIRKLVATAIRKYHAHAISLFKEYLIENGGYQFLVKRYKSYSVGVKECPVSSTVLFSIQDKNVCPLSSPTVPFDRNNWYDSSWNPIELEKFMTSIPYYTSQDVRIYKILEKDAVSDDEIKNFVEQGTNFWEYFVYRCEDYEPKYREKGEFRKNLTKMVREKAEEEKEITKNEALQFEDDGAIIGIVVDGVLHGKTYEEIYNRIMEMHIKVSDEDIKIIYDRECYNIIKSNQPYIMLMKMMSDGMRQKNIIKELKVSPTTFKRMKDTLLVIPAEIKAQFDSVDTVAEPEQTEAIPPETDIEAVEETPTEEIHDEIKEEPVEEPVEKPKKKRKKSSK